MDNQIKTALAEIGVRTKSDLKVFAGVSTGIFILLLEFIFILGLNASVIILSGALAIFGFGYGVYRLLLWLTGGLD